MIKKILKIVTSLVILFGLAVIALAILIGWQSYRFWLQSPTQDSSTVVFEVVDGQSSKEITQNLKNEALIANKFWFTVYSRLDGSARNLMAGEFELQPGLSYKSVIDVLTNAQVDELSITIPEGYTLDQIGELVMANFDVSEAEWGTLTGMGSKFEQDPFVVQAAKPENVDLEGYLFPDTYRFFAEAEAEEIVQKLLKTTEQRLETLGQSPSDWTWHEVLTLASIIEREVMTDEDRGLVADLFLRRLEMGMALQADSTVNYITGKKTPGISLADRDIDSPYNTYMYPGLPPGPISSPGLASIQAVLQPTPNSYLYFLTTEEGEVIYSLTHDDHVQAKNRYLR